MAASSTETTQFSSSFPSSGSSDSLPVVVFSLDMDGALLSRSVSEYIRDKGVDLGLPFRKDYKSLPKEDIEALKNVTKEALEKAHAALIEHILSLIPDGAIAYFISGSNRQTRKRDFHNGSSGSRSNDNGSSFIALQAFVSIIQGRLEKRAAAVLDKTLLEDLANQKLPGTYFNSALQRGCVAPFPLLQGHKEDVDDADDNTEIDDAKRILIYTQMQHFAAKHLRTSIAFHFYDDDTNPSTPKQIIAGLQLFFGQQVINGINTFLDNCVNDIRVKINITKQHILNAQLKLLAQATAIVSPATSSMPATEISQTEPITIAIVDQATSSMPVVETSQTMPTTIDALLATYQEQMLENITQLKTAFEVFQGQHSSREDAYIKLDSALSDFKKQQDSARNALRGELEKLKNTDAAVRVIYSIVYSVPLSDLVKEILDLLYLFLPEAPFKKQAEGLSDEEVEQGIVIRKPAEGLSDEEVKQGILNILAKPQSQIADKVPANIHLHLHKYVGSESFELTEQAALLVDKPVIKGTGPFDPGYKQNYCVTSKELNAKRFGHVSFYCQACFCRVSLNNWHAATTAQQKLSLSQDGLSQAPGLSSSKSSQQEGSKQRKDKFFSGGSSSSVPDGTTICTHTSLKKR